MEYWLARADHLATDPASSQDAPLIVDGSGKAWARPKGGAGAHAHSLGDA